MAQSPARSTLFRKSFRPIRWLLIGLAGLVALLILGSALVMALGITLSAAPWRDQLARAVQQAVGREVRFAGALALQPTLTPAFHVGGITVANPPGFDTPFFAELEQATLRVDLLALLRGEIRVRELSAKGVKAHLERNASAQVNWLFRLQPATPGETPKQNSGKPSARLVEVDRIDLESLSVDYVGGPGLPVHQFALDRLHGEGGEGKPLTLAMNGSVEGRFPYTMSFTGGALSALNTPDTPWPINFNLQFLGTTLVINGSVRPDAAQTSADLTFALGSENLVQLEHLLQTSLPPVGATGLSARVRWDNGILDIQDLQAVMGQSTMAGHIKVDITQTVPRVAGTFNMPVLDVSPFRQKPPEQSEQAVKPAANDTSQDLQALKTREFQFRELALVEADLQLDVKRLIGVPGDVRDAMFKVSLHNGILHAPVMASVADVPLTGEIELDGASATPRFGLDLSAQNTTLGRLATVLTGAPGVQGQLGHFLLHFAGTGKNIPALAQSLEMKLEIAAADLTYGNIKGGKPVEMHLDRLDVTLPSGGRLQGKIEGSLLRERFTAQFKGGDLPTLSREIRWPVDLQVSGSGATLDVSGQVAAPEKTAGTDLTIKLHAGHAGSVARWLGLSPKATAAVDISGHVRVESDEWRLNDLSVQLGKTRMSGDFARVGIDRKPLVQAKLRVENLELAELEAMLPPAKPGPAKPVIELPILPQGIDLTDADVDVAVKRIALKPIPVTDISFLGRIREGKMYASPFAAQYADTRFSGAMALDMRGQSPEATLWVSAGDVDIGGMLRRLGVVENLEVKAGQLVLQLIAKGHRLGEMLEQSSVLASVDSGMLVLRDANSKNGLPIALSKGLIEAKPREPVHVDLDGRIDKTPIKITVFSGTAVELMRASSFVPFEMTAEAAGTKLRLSGRLSLPVSQKAVELDLAVAGDKISSLEELARMSLPKWGPYTLASRFRISPAGYEMPGLSLKVGSSELKGKGSVVTTGVRPRIDLSLAAPLIQLDDFKLEGWALAQGKPVAEEKKLTEEELRKKARDASADTEKMLSPAVLGRQDVSLSVDVTQVVSGRDRLGSGSLRAGLNDGKLVLGPAEVNVPGGSAKFSLSYHPTASGIAMDTRIRVDRFDYGVLARRYKPESDLQGLFSLQVDFESRPPSLYQAMQKGNGKIDFAVWPKNMKSGIFDLWAVNLFVALIPAVDSGSESKVNCAVGRFDLKAGVLTEDSIMLDTSRMRVSGKGRVDFDTESLSMYLAPKPKKAQFFNLATPVEVSGKLTDPKIGVSVGAVAGTTARFLTSIITAPLEMLFSKEIPRDGKDVCDNALRQSREPRG